MKTALLSVMLVLGTIGVAHATGAALSKEQVHEIKKQCHETHKKDKKEYDACVKEKVKETKATTASN
jgi:hypothetical protein